MLSRFDFWSLFVLLSLSKARWGSFFQGSDSDVRLICRIRQRCCLYGHFWSFPCSGCEWRAIRHVPIEMWHLHMPLVKVSLSLPSSPASSRGSEESPSPTTEDIGVSALQFPLFCAKTKPILLSGCWRLEYRLWWTRHGWRKVRGWKPSLKPLSDHLRSGFGRFSQAACSAVPNEMMIVAYLIVYCGLEPPLSFVLQRNSLFLPVRIVHDFLKTLSPLNLPLNEMHGKNLIFIIPVCVCVWFGTT